ncbi:phage tail protein [Stappia sp.]|uniref:phage tail protein n=1 Tax=Stappia sp. TaxID=1870903 RepID=UPI003C7C0E5D
MAVPLLALGRHVFEILPLNFQSIERETEARWPAVERFGRAPGRQFTGIGENPVTITGLLYPEEFGGRDEFEAIRATQMAATPVMMVGWTAETAGRVFGRVVIQRVFDTQSIISRAGQGRKLEFSIEVAPHAGDGAPGGLFR